MVFDHLFWRLFGVLGHFGHFYIVWFSGLLPGLLRLFGLPRGFSLRALDAACLYLPAPQVSRQKSLWLLRNPSKRSIFGDFNLLYGVFARPFTAFWPSERVFPARARCNLPISTSPPSFKAKIAVVTEKSFKKVHFW